MMFEDMIGVSANPFAVPANPVPMEPTELQRQLYTDDPKLDAPRSQAKDLSLDALLHEMRKAHRTTVTARLGVNPGEAYYTSPVYAPSAPTLLDDTGAGTPFDEEEVAPARDAVGADDVFGRYLADSFGGDTDPMHRVTVEVRVQRATDGPQRPALARSPAQAGALRLIDRPTYGHHTWLTNSTI